MDADKPVNPLNLSHVEVLMGKLASRKEMAKEQKRLKDVAMKNIQNKNGYLVSTRSLFATNLINEQKPLKNDYS